MANTLRNLRFALVVSAVFAMAMDYVATMVNCEPRYHPDFGILIIYFPFALLEFGLPLFALVVVLMFLGEKINTTLARFARHRRVMVALCALFGLVVAAWIYAHAPAEAGACWL